MKNIFGLLLLSSASMIFAMEDIQKQFELENKKLEQKFKKLNMRLEALKPLVEVNNQVDGKTLIKCIDDLRKERDHGYLYSAIALADLGESCRNREFKIEGESKKMLAGLLDGDRVHDKYVPLYLKIQIYLDFQKEMS